MRTRHALIPDWRRKARKLRQYLPFTASTIAKIKQQADDHRREEREDLRTVLALVGNGQGRTTGAWASAPYRLSPLA